MTGYWEALTEKKHSYVLFPSQNIYFPQWYKGAVLNLFYLNTRSKQMCKFLWMVEPGFSLLKKEVEVRKEVRLE